MTSAEPAHEPEMPSPRFFYAASLAAGLFFAVWSWLALQGEWLPAFDLHCAQYWDTWSRESRRWGAVMVFLTDLGGIASMTLLAIMGAIWQTAIKHRFLAIAWLGIVVGGAMLNLGLKETFDRPRPPEPLRHRVVHETNQSYPSGHAMGSTVSYGLLAYALLLPQRRRPRRVATLLLLTGIVLAVGFSRIYLRAHWFSDVVGGWAIGMTWLFLAIGWLERQRRRV